jgi:hypothetical protein
VTDDCSSSRCGLLLLLAALGLQPAGRAGRVLLASGGVAVLLIAAFRQPHRGYSLPHELAVIAAALTCCTWPVFASRRRHPALLLTRAASIAAVAVSIGLATWYTLETNGPLLGLAERCAATAPPLWLLLTVVVTTRHTLTQGHPPSGEPKSAVMTTSGGSLNKVSECSVGVGRRVHSSSDSCSDEA